MLSPFVYKNLNPVFAKKMKFVVKRRSESLQWQRQRLLEKFPELAIVDIGANVGQFVTEVRSYGYKGLIYSIEPFSSSYSKLEILRAKDKYLKTYRRLILEENGRQNIYGFSRSDLNSILLPSQNDMFEVGESIEEEIVTSQTLDDFLDREVRDGEVFVKIDTQGSELKVLSGLKANLHLVRAIQVETSIKPIYENAATLNLTLEWILDNGFQTISIATERFDELSCLAYDIDILAVQTTI